MIDQIIAYKPDSIFNVVPRECFNHDENTDYLHSGNCFEWNYAVAKAIRPKSYLEVGVRFGYSFIPTLYGGMPSLRIAIGWDLETYGNNQIARQNIKNYGPSYTFGDGYGNLCGITIEHQDSQKIQELPQFFDLIYIDGCHDYDCKMHDLRLTVGKCKYVYLDDYDYLVDVRRATDDFMREVGTDGWGKSSIIEWAAYLPTFRGSWIIKYKV